MTRSLNAGTICLSLLGVLAAALTLPLMAQTPPPAPEKPHDITRVDTAPVGGVIAIPLPPQSERRMRKYEIPELVGARQALGSQLVAGELPRPLLDYRARHGSVDQRLSVFEGGLVVVRMTSAAGELRKRVILPSDALTAYRRVVSPDAVRRVRSHELVPPRDDRAAFLRAYDELGVPVHVEFDPMAALPKPLADPVNLLQDLLRAISEDRNVTSTVANYEPQVGDELVGDEGRAWRVERVMADIVQLRCTSQPSIVYIDKKYLQNYFIGRR